MLRLRKRKAISRLVQAREQKLDLVLQLGKGVTTKRDYEETEVVIDRAQSKRQLVFALEAKQSQFGKVWF